MKTSSVRPRRRATMSPPRPRPRTSPRSRASPKSRQVPEKATGTQTRITALTRTLHKTCPEVTIDLDLSSEDGPAASVFHPLLYPAGSPHIRPDPSSSPGPGPSLSLSPGPSLSLSPGPSLSLSPGPSPSLSPGPSPSLSPGPSPSLSPGPSPSLSPGLSSGLSPGPSSGLSLGLSPGHIPGLSPGPSPGPSPGSDVVDLTALTSDPAAVVDLTNDTVLVLDEGESLLLPSFLPSLSSEPSRARTRRDRRETDQPSYVVSSDEEEAAVIETPVGASASVHRRERTSGVHINCPVCMDSYFEIVDSGRLLVSTRCGHIFCSVCLRDSLNQSHSCPICRKKLPKGHYHPLHL